MPIRTRNEPTADGTPEFDQEVQDVVSRIESQQRAGKDGYEIAIYLLQNTQAKMDKVMEAFRRLGYAITPTRSQITNQENGFRVSSKPNMDFPPQRLPQKIIWRRKTR
jgi:hypothetical protein